MGCSGINYLNIKVYIKINAEQTTVKIAKFFLVIYTVAYLIYSQSRYIATYQYNISRRCALKTNLTEFHVNLKAAC